MRELFEELLQLKSKGRYRHLRQIENISNNYVKVDGRTLLMCASNNYLGLSKHPLTQKAAIEAITQHGVGSTGARLTTGNSPLHEQLEKEIANLKGTESAIVFNTGYMANLAVLTALTGPEDVIFSDELNHASIIDACRLSKAKIVIYKHSDLQDLEMKLKQEVYSRRKIIVTDGVFSMDGDIAPVAGLVELSENFLAWLMIDDAHGTGVLGSTGGGTADYFGMTDRVFIQMGTMSKAIGSEGGYIAGSQILIDYLRNRARPYIYSTALSPGVIAASIEGIRLVRDQPNRREELRQRVMQLREGLRAEGFQVPLGETPIVPVILGGEEKALAFSSKLESEGIFAPAIRPPTVPNGTSRIRLTITATHTEAEIEQIIKGFRNVAREVGHYEKG